jgi:hypothetical protein
MKLVGSRHEKRELVNLVRALILERDNAEKRGMEKASELIDDKAVHGRNYQLSQAKQAILTASTKS